MTWATFVPILVFLGLSVLDLGQMYATDRETDRRQTKPSLNSPAYKGGGIIKLECALSDDANPYQQILTMVMALYQCVFGNSPKIRRLAS